MPKLFFIAEKPSLAKTIAEVRAKMLGVSASRGPHYFTVGSDCVTWLYGHMYELVDPEHYDERFKSWRIDDLPMIPSGWKREPKRHKGKDKKESAQKDRDLVEHLKAIQGVLKSSETVVNAGDAEREGQLLVDELLIEMGWNPFSPKTKRFWNHSLTDAEVTKSIETLLANGEKENLFNAAFARQRADWLHGMNMTRLYTGLARRSGADMLVSVGRVQTPTLKLVVDRDREIANFKPTDHFLPTGWFAHENGKFKATWVIPVDYDGLDSEGRLVDKGVAQKIIDSVSGKQGTVSSFETKSASSSAPLPYSLSALQQACSAKFGLTAQQTLDVAQALYEKHKATSYPRTDSRHLPVSVLKEQAPAIMASMTTTPGVDKAAQAADMKLRSKAWDDSKVSDHHGIIPTTDFHAGKLNDMSPIERSVFMLIAKSFVAQFHPDQTWKAISAEVTVGPHRFRVTGKLPVSQGWRVVYDGETDEDEDDDKEENQTIPPMKRGDAVTCEKGELSPKRTKPPAAYTDGTLIAAMTNVHKFIDDPELKKRLKENEGIGTEATRANIIETLILRRFIQRGSGKVKKITSTEAGRSIIDVLPPEITSPGLTAVWEAQLSKIARGEADVNQFMKVLSDTLHKRVEQGRNSSVKIKGQSVEPLKGDGEKCPQCGKGVLRTRTFSKGEMKGKRILSCDAYNAADPNSCRYAVWPDRPKADPVPPAPDHGKPCPKCGKGKLVTKKSSKGTIYLSCDNWHGKDNPDNCNHYEFPEEKEKMAGDGDKCTECNKGVMQTRKAKSGPNAGKMFLSCSEYPTCKKSIFPDTFKSGKSDGSGGGRSSSGSGNSSQSGGRPAGSARSTGKSSFSRPQSKN